MGKARRRRGLIAIEAIRGVDAEKLAERHHLSKKRVQKAIKAGLTANGLPSDSGAALKQGLEKLRQAPDQAIEQIKEKAGLIRQAPAEQTTRKNAETSAREKTKPAKESAPDSKQEEKETDGGALPTRLQNILLDSSYASDGVIDRQAVAAADPDELQALPGCGKASAEKILDWAAQGESK